jgi:hypothetical protein
MSETLFSGAEDTYHMSIWQTVIWKVTTGLENSLCNLLLDEETRHEGQLLLEPQK